MAKLRFTPKGAVDKNTMSVKTVAHTAKAQRLSKENGQYKRALVISGLVNLGLAIWIIIDLWGRAH